MHAIGTGTLCQVAAATKSSADTLEHHCSSINIIQVRDENISPIGSNSEAEQANAHGFKCALSKLMRITSRISMRSDINIIMVPVMHDGGIICFPPVLLELTSTHPDRVLMSPLLPNV